MSYLVHMDELADAYGDHTGSRPCSPVSSAWLQFGHRVPLVVTPRLYPAASRYQLNGKALGIFSTWLKKRSSKAGLKLMLYAPGSKDGSAFYLLYMHKLWLIQP